ncbi:MAG TPA: hypothetical protein VIV34_03680 [Pseudolabrys sp.]
MTKITIVLATVLLILATEVDAQNVSGQVNGTVGGIGSVASQTTAGVTGSGGSQPYYGVDTSTGSSTGGNIPGGLGLKVGDKVIKLRGAAGVGDDRRNVKAGVGIPF